MFRLSNIFTSVQTRERRIKGLFIGGQKECTHKHRRRKEGERENKIRTVTFLFFDRLESVSEVFGNPCRFNMLLTMVDELWKLRFRILINSFSFPKSIVTNERRRIDVLRANILLFFFFLDSPYSQQLLSHVLSQPMSV